MAPVNLVNFADYLAHVRSGVDVELQRVLDERVTMARAHGPVVHKIVEATRSLAMRGGKRFRAALLLAAFEACGGEGGLEAVLPAGVAIELLQTYLLIHDDWMDDDDTRRGGPSVHASLAATFGSASVGATYAILAGDHASALAQSALLSLRLPEGRVVEVAREFARIQEDVVFGQMLDVCAEARDGASVERMNDLKTGSYTVRGPLAMGAILAGASPEQRGCLTRFAGPLGVAFQLRDDLLGTFGDPASTGKPSGNDLRQGKRTALVLEMEKDASLRAILGGVFGVRNAAPERVETAMAALLESGIKGRVEARLEALLEQSSRALHDADGQLTARGREILAGAVKALGHRER